MQLDIITQQEIEQRDYWVQRISDSTGDFSESVEKIEQELLKEIEISGISSLIGHLRLCGTLPEKYTVNSSEEKLYSKYTDAVISLAYSRMGFTSIVLTERANSADVEASYGDISFVADAKVFRLSRTAKNQKDFKIQAMDSWKYGKPYAMVVCPIYQLSSKNSQIYQQSGARSVLIGTYTHLAVLVRYAKRNHMLNFDPAWTEEKLATLEAIYVSRQEALTYLASERQRILSLSKQDAIKEILKSSKIEKKIAKIETVVGNEILDIG